MRFQPVLNRILVPTDGTVGSMPAMQIGASIAKSSKSRVTVIYSLADELASLQNQYTWEVTRGPGTELPPEPNRRTELMTPELMKAYDEMESQTYQKSQGILADAVAFFKQEGVIADERLVEDAQPAEAILREAEDGTYDLVVMGRREGDEEGFHLGSVAQRVARYSRIPVLVTGSATRRIAKILVAFDDSRDAERALQYGAYLAKDLAATLTVVYVSHLEIGVHRTEQDREGKNLILARASEIIDNSSLDKKVGSGDPAKVITQLAQKESYDLVVMGSKGHSTAERFLLGSVSEHVIHYTDKSVLIVR